ncbi:MAG: diguanylate cyclase protein [Herbinix sp.]|jgi:diguanylate cyclase (GGDEF)-like protein|nr:diguanylate cyclase protein [Herbinix sp.]
MIRVKGKIIKITATIGIVVIFLMVFNSYNTYAKHKGDVQNVLILNSYHQGFSWTKEQTEGIIDTLKVVGHNFSFRVEYMDWKNYNTAQNIEHLIEYYDFKYRNEKIDIIITTDDAALEFALEYREKLFSDAPVVFTGVNMEGMRRITDGYDRVTGVIEVINPAQTLMIAKEINPFLKYIYLLNDNTESGRSTSNIVIKTIGEIDPNIKVINWSYLPFEEAVQKAGELNDQSIILIGTYFRDINDKLYDNSYVTMEISENSIVPVYHLYDFGINHGIIGGTLLCGRIQGENAAELAISILEGEDSNLIPVKIPNSTRTVFDYNQLLRFNIPLKILPKDSEIINKPFSFYETYRTLVISVIVAFTVLFSFVSILLFYIRKINKMKHKLKDSNEELTGLYEELYASDVEIKQQYNEIVVINEKIKLSEEKLANLAYYDSLTGVMNKLSLYEKSELTSIQAKRAALLFIDIDNFKYVNDTLGHAFGDKLIIKVAERLTALLRECCTLYRLSGDEFVIIIDPLEDRVQAEVYSSYLLENFRNDFDSLGSNLHISLSIGIAICPDHGKELEQLLKHADIAMYEAKVAGRKNYVVYDQGMNEVFKERIMIEKHLQSALDEKEFELYYQPQLDIGTNKITGFEALLRWKSPVLGSVSPLKFIKVAEDTHFIIPLGTWVLRKACEFLGRLEVEGYHGLTVSVNISILQLLQSDFLDIVEEALSTYNIQPENLELEITETILMESFDRIIMRLRRLRDKKIRIALDDFGKGYSSLNYLKQLPITTMKVDKSFIDSITDESQDDLVGHIISLGKNMGMSVVAEGVEEQCQLDYLAAHECDKIQGYLFCKPLPEVAIMDFISNNRD